MTGVFIPSLRQVAGSIDVQSFNFTEVAGSQHLEES